MRIVGGGGGGGLCGSVPVVSFSLMSWEFALRFSDWMSWFKRPTKRPSIASVDGQVGPILITFFLLSFLNISISAHYISSNVSYISNSNVQY